MAENSLPIQIEISVDEASSNRTYAQIKQKAEQEGRKLGQSLTEGFKLSPRAIEEQIVSTVRQARGGARKEMERLYNDLFRVESAVTSLGTKGAIESRLINEIRQASGSAKSEMERMYAELFRVDSIVKSTGTKNLIESRIQSEISSVDRTRLQSMYDGLFGQITRGSEIKSTGTKNFIESRIVGDLKSVDRVRLQKDYNQIFGALSKNAVSGYESATGLGSTQILRNTVDLEKQKSAELSKQVGMLGALGDKLGNIALLTTQLTRAFFGLGLALSAITAPAVFGGAYLKSLEDAQHGISANLTAMSKAAGGSLTYAQSSAIAAEAIDKLSKESIRYNISLEDIVKTYQAIIGPGMAAGMTFEEIGRVATIGAVATKSLALDSRQVVQEVRDLVQGGIQAASSTLATSLGLTDKDIKAAKQSTEGLFVFLERRLEGYTISAMERQNTLGGAFELLKMKVQRLFADDQSYKQFTQFITSVSNSIAKVNEQTKELEFNPTLVEVTKDYMAALRGVSTSLVDVASLVGKVVGLVFEMNAAMGQIPLASLVAYIAYTKIATAQMTLLTTSVTLANAATMKLAMTLGVLGAAFAGYTFGKIMYEQFEEARKAGTVFVAVMLKGFNMLRYGAEEVAAALQLGKAVMASGTPIEESVKTYNLARDAAKKSYEDQKKFVDEWAVESFKQAERVKDNAIGNSKALSEEERRIQRNQSIAESRADAAKYADKKAKLDAFNAEAAKLSQRLLTATSAGATQEQKSEAWELYTRGLEKAKTEYEKLSSVEKSALKDSQRAEKERIKGIEQDFKREQQLLDAQYSLKDKQIDQAVKYGLAEEAANIIRKSSAEDQLQSTMALQDSYIKMLQNLTGLDAAQKIHRDNKLREIQDARELIEVRQRENQVLDEQRAIMKNLAAERELGVSVRESGQAAAKMIREMDAEQKKKYTIVDPVTFAGSEAEAKFRESRQNDLDKYTNKINISKDAIESAELSWKSGITTTEEFLKVTLLQSDAINKATDAYNKQQAAIDAGSGVVRKKAETDAKYNESFKGGAEQAFNEYTKGALTAADMTRQAFGNTFKAMEDGLVEFVKTGKLSFGSFVNTVIDGLIRMAAKAAVTNLGQMAGLGSTSAGAGIGGFMGGIGSLVKSFLPFANGAAFDGVKKYAKGAAFGAMVATSPMTAFANGGAFTNNLYSKPTLMQYADGGVFKPGVIGEAGPEAVVPLHRGPGGSLGIANYGAPTGGSGESNVVVNVVVNVDAGGNSDVQTNGQGMGKGIGDLIGAKVREVILVEQRPGGSLNRSR